MLVTYSTLYYSPKAEVVIKPLPNSLSKKKSDLLNEVYSNYKGHLKTSPIPYNPSQQYEPITKLIPNNYKKVKSSSKYLKLLLSDHKRVKHLPLSHSQAVALGSQTIATMLWCCDIGLLTSKVTKQLGKKYFLLLSYLLGKRVNLVTLNNGIITVIKAECSIFTSMKKLCKLVLYYLIYGYTVKSISTFLVANTVISRLNTANNFIQLIAKYPETVYQHFSYSIGKEAMYVQFIRNDIELTADELAQYTKIADRYRHYNN